VVEQAVVSILTACTVRSAQMLNYEKALGESIERENKLKAENKQLRDVLEFLVVSKANDRVKMECVKRALKGKKDENNP